MPAGGVDTGGGGTANRGGLGVWQAVAILAGLLVLLAVGGGLLLRHNRGRRQRVLAG